ncbi:hypothetical protein ACLB2K_040897 [Fragaria x ananassa]
MHYKTRSRVGTESDPGKQNMEMAMKRQRSSSDDAKKQQLMELPTEILLEILLRLPAKSVGCIKCVSKTLLNMVNNISFSTLHTRLLFATNSPAAADQVPRLMYCSLNHPAVTLQSVKHKDDTLTKGRYAITISSSPSCFLCFVFCNVFCLGSKNGDCMLINPLGERGVLRLPESSFARLEGGPDVYRNSWFGMGFDDKTNTYKIVCVTSDGDGFHRSKAMTAHVLVLGSNSWRKISSLPPGQLNWIDDELMICSNGAVHWLTCDRRIVSFDFKREEFCLTPTPPTLQSSKTNHLDSNMSLFTLRGCLAIVETKRSWRQCGIEIWMLQDFDEKQWVRYYCNNKIKDYFPSQFHGPSKFHGPPGEWEHGIFFTFYDLFDTRVFFIDLRDGSIKDVMYPLHGRPREQEVRDFLIGMYSYSETLISLKDYGDLDRRAHQVLPD